VDAAAAQRKPLDQVAITEYRVSSKTGALSLISTISHIGLQNCAKIAGSPLF
jgi:hypothetical protein